jgi:hypothetical protein
MNGLRARRLLLLFCLPSAASRQFYAGTQGGLSTLSADARSVLAETPKAPCSGPGP